MKSFCVIGPESVVRFLGSVGSSEDPCAKRNAVLSASQEEIKEAF